MTKKITKSSGNVFEDLGINNSGEHRVKADLTIKLIKLIKSRRLTQAQAAKEVGASQPDISNLMNGNIRGFTLDRLIGFLDKLNVDVRLTLRERSTRKLIARKERVGPQRRIAHSKAKPRSIRIPA